MSILWEKDQLIHLCAKHISKLICVQNWSQLSTSLFFNYCHQFSTLKIKEAIKRYSANRVSQWIFQNRMSIIGMSYLITSGRKGNNNNIIKACCFFWVDYFVVVFAWKLLMRLVHFGSSGQQYHRYHYHRCSKGGMYIYPFYIFEIEQ